MCRRVVLDVGKEIFFNDCQCPLTLIVIHILGIVHFLRTLNAVTVNVTFIKSLYVLILCCTSSLCECSEVVTSHHHRTLHIGEYSRSLIVCEVLIVHNSLCHCAHILIGGKVKRCSQRLPYLFAKQFCCVCISLVYTVLH